MTLSLHDLLQNLVSLVGSSDGEATTSAEAPVKAVSTEAEVEAPVKVASAEAEAPVAVEKAGGKVISDSPHVKTLDAEMLVQIAREVAALKAASPTLISGGSPATGVAGDLEARYAAAQASGNKAQMESVHTDIMDTMAHQVAKSMSTGGGSVLYDARTMRGD